MHSTQYNQKSKAPEEVKVFPQYLVKSLGRKRIVIIIIYIYIYIFKLIAKI